MIKDLLTRRFATKHFDPAKPVSAQDLNEILDAARLSPSSFGIQAWQFFAIANSDLKQKLAPACWGQPQITEAPVVVILAARTDLLGDDGVIKKFMAKSQKDQNRTAEQTAGYEKYITDAASKLSAEETKVWSQKQVYLAGMTMMLAAMEKGIDSCPMEGFVPDQVSKILDLPAHIIPTLIIPLGYKNMEQPVKTRFELADVVKEIK